MICPSVNRLGFMSIPFPGDGLYPFLEEFSGLRSSASYEKRPLIFPARGKSDLPFNGWSKAEMQLDNLSGVSGWNLQDLRRTFRTNLAKLGVPSHIAECLVKHISARTDMEDTYDLYTYLPEMRDAVNRWETHVASILANAADNPAEARAA